MLHGLRLVYYVRRVGSIHRRGWKTVLGWFQCEICGSTFVARVCPVEDDRVTCTDPGCNQMHLAELAKR
ncbi:hypothetical protein GCM10007977_066520 [Dactylosporangium sucinum]|uniref:Uncharacterized protein n=1 Tax=Dactylosporangium sucinum TaxID=1424081 RepID=A0A917U3I4_9ACTN|nr:hypothetical protein GCM10007977_066520 [Dactylosporangium sucinum]